MKTSFVFTGNKLSFMGVFAVMTAIENFLVTSVCSWNTQISTNPQGTKKSELTHEQSKQSE